MYTQNDYEKLTEAVSKIKLLEDKNNAMGSYKNAALICIDAVLSINRKYYSFVVPRIKIIQENYHEINSLTKLQELIKRSSIEEFSKIWNYNHPQRIKTLSNLVDRLIACADIKEYDSTKTELEKLQMWAKTVNAYDYDTFNVQGIGIATYQYIRMMLGAKTVKPDVYIKRYISSVLNKNLNEKDIIDIFEKACHSKNIDVSQADHSLWKQNARDVDVQYLWENDKWISRELVK